MNNRLYGKLIFELSKEGRRGYSLPKNSYSHTSKELPAALMRNEPAELPECDELTVVRHYTNHSNNNFGVNNGFYPLGSCTMKYNPIINEEVAAHPAFVGLHPLQPQSTCLGALELHSRVRKMLSALTGMSDFTLSPCAGAHGELTGLMIIRSYHESRGDNKRTRVIIPDSAHGTNPASAAVCGLEVVEVKSTADGMVDVEHLRTLLDDTIAGMMMTNPNTLGLFERNIPEIAALVHECGGLMHINLHKTFSTPHGGGGPGSGPVGVRKGLEQFLETVTIGPFYGNYGVVMRAYAYLMSLGKENVKNVGPLATLNANYVKERLKDLYELPIDRTCMHEFVFDGLKDKSTGVTTMDIAKRLLDYGYHAPTIYFPLLFHESMMIEPTENESRETLDAFIDVMRTIAQEAHDNPELVKGAPHNTPIGRVDDVEAAKHPVVIWSEE